ncbi:MAG: hypothetical protein OXU96_08905 [Gammaproteobacteria bacterium]|nr:hypothetical protein [Gammaproteobacteria bacterium]
MRDAHSTQSERKTAGMLCRNQGLFLICGKGAFCIVPWLAYA